MNVQIVSLVCVISLTKQLLSVLVLVSFFIPLIINSYMIYGQKIFNKKLFYICGDENLVVWW